jgi:hypothetical protein
LSEGLVEFDAYWLSASTAHGLFILRQGALGIFTIPGMRHGNGYARGRGLRFIEI